MKMIIAFTLLVAGVTTAAAQMWTEDMSNGARTNPNIQSVQPRATRNGSPSYGATNRSATQRDNSARRGTVNPYARTDRDMWGR
jgi:hypothetical protein